MTTVLQELLKCGICAKLLNEARILPCSHSFCASCISQTLSRNSLIRYTQQQQQQQQQQQEEVGILKCLICGTEHKSVQSSTQLPKNDFIENILKSLHLDSNNNNNNNKNKKQIYCENDESHEATEYCGECEAYLCSSCFSSTHTFGKLKKHKPQSLDDSIQLDDRNNSEPSKCVKHPKYHNDLYCGSCHSPICPLCLVDDHNDTSKHKVTSAEKYIEEIKSKLLQRCDMILNDSSKFKDELQMSNTKITNYHLQIKDLQNKITDLQNQLDSEILKESNLQRKLNEITSIHQLISSSINQYFSAESSELIRNQQMITHCAADISMIYEKLYSLKLPLSNNGLFEPPITEGIWSLNPNSFKGDASTYKLISSTHFEKLKIGHCAITCIESIKQCSVTTAFHHYQWHIQYLPMDPNYEGWLYIAFHTNPSAHSANSCNEIECVGWNISNPKGPHPTSNGSYFYSEYTPIETLQAQSGDILIFSLDTKSKIIRLEHESWNVQTIVEEFEHYYLHFDSYGASFKILSCSLS